MDPGDSGSAGTSSRWVKNHSVDLSVVEASLFDWRIRTLQPRADNAVREAIDDISLLVLAQVLAGITRGSDRKSTRLNSSHVAISYAVFCLKKKSKKHT